MKIRTAMVGPGRIAWDFHLPELTKHPHFQPVAAVDPLKERQLECRQRFNVPEGYADFDQMLQAEHPDLVVIASPTNSHCEQIIKAFAAGNWC